MDITHIVEDAKGKYRSVFEHFQNELKKVRTGRALPSMLDGVKVTAYGVDMPMNQVGSITAPESQLLQITPFDPANLQAIVSAIRDNTTLGLNPSDDGRVIRISIPPLNEERRREYTKVLGGKVEAAMIALRSVRRDTVDAIDQAKKDKAIGEDEAKRLLKQVDEAMNAIKLEIDSSGKAKEAEIMTV